MDYLDGIYKGFRTQDETPHYLWSVTLKADAPFLKEPVLGVGESTKIEFAKLEAAQEIVDDIAEEGGNTEFHHFLNTYGKDGWQYMKEHNAFPILEKLKFEFGFSVRTQRQKEENSDRCRIIFHISYPELKDINIYGDWNKSAFIAKESAVINVLCNSHLRTAAEAVKQGKIPEELKKVPIQLLEESDGIPGSVVSPELIERAEGIYPEKMIKHLKKGTNLHVLNILTTKYGCTIEEQYDEREGVHPFCCTLTLSHPDMGSACKVSGKWGTNKKNTKKSAIDILCHKAELLDLISSLKSKEKTKSTDNAVG